MNSEGVPATYNVQVILDKYKYLIIYLQVGNASLHYNTSVYDVHDIGT